MIRMSNNEQFRARVVAGLTGILVVDDVQNVMKVIDTITADYNMTQKTTALTVVGDIPDQVKSYIASKAVENKARRTLHEYRSVLMCFFKLMNKKLSEITTNDIRLYMYKYKEVRHVKDNRIEFIRVVLNNFYEWCVQEGELDKNPARRIAVIKKPKTERQPMSLKDLEKIRFACKDTREKALIDFLYSTACRISEVSNIMLEDIDMENGIAKIRHGKGDKERTVYINAECSISMQEYLKHRMGNSPYLFVTSRSPYKKMSIKSLENMVKKIVSRTDVRVHVTPHVFRHTTATVAIKNGMPVEQVQQMLGHTSLDTTMIYTKIDNNQVKYNHERYVN